MKEIIATICVLGLFGSFFALWGIAGGIQCDEMSISTGAFAAAGVFVVLLLCVAGLMKIEKDEEEENYGRL